MGTKRTAEFRHEAGVVSNRMKRDFAIRALNMAIALHRQQIPLA